MNRTKLLSLLAILIFIYSGFKVQGQCFNWTKEEAEVWFQKAEWLGGLALKPHESIDILEFAKKYHKNKDFWDKAFAFLRDTNLDTISPGKYQILGDSVFASITENPTKTMDQSKWEFHKLYTDIQIVIKGKEKMGKTPVGNITVTDPYNEKKDIGFGTYEAGDYYTVEPGVFLIFFPIDGHRPALKVEGCDKDKKIVIKVLTN